MRRFSKILDGFPGVRPITSILAHCGLYKDLVWGDMHERIGPTLCVGSFRYDIFESQLSKSINSNVA